MHCALCVFAGAGVLPLIDRTAASHSSGGFISYLVAMWVAGSIAHRRRSVALLLIGIAVPAWIIAQDRELRSVEIIPYALLLFAVWLLAQRRRLEPIHHDGSAAVVPSPPRRGTMGQIIRRRGGAHPLGLSTRAAISLSWPTRIDPSGDDFRGSRA